MLIALGSWRGSPGVTTSTLALAEAWPDNRDVYVAECDPRGGTLAARFVLPGTRRMVSLAGDARNNGDVQLLRQHAVEAPGSGVSCLTGPEDGTRLRAALAALLVDGGVFESAADDSDSVLLADCGRLEPDVPEVASLLMLADLLVIVASPSFEHALYLSGVREQLVKLHPNIGLLLTGSGYPAGQITELLNLPVLGELPAIAPRAAMRGLERMRAGLGPSRFRKTAAEAAMAISQAAHENTLKVEA